MKDGMTLKQEAMVKELEQLAYEMGTMQPDDFRKMRLILYDFRVMAQRLDECREVMEANDPINAAMLFGTPQERAGG